jgi:hypothetical protein
LADVWTYVIVIIIFVTKSTASTLNLSFFSSCTILGSPPPQDKLLSCCGGCTIGFELSYGDNHLQPSPLATQSVVHSGKFELSYWDNYSLIGLTANNVPKYVCLVVLFTHTDLNIAIDLNLCFGPSMIFCMIHLSGPLLPQFT